MDSHVAKRDPYDSLGDLTLKSSWIKQPETLVSKRPLDREAYDPHRGFPVTCPSFKCPVKERDFLAGLPEVSVCKREYRGCVVHRRTTP